jgi:hypothetical protein
MIKVNKVTIEENEQTDIRKVIVGFTAARSYRMRGNTLILGYPLRFKELNNIGESIVFSLLPILYREGADISLPDDIAVEPETQERVDRIFSLWNKWFMSNRKARIYTNFGQKTNDFSVSRHSGQLFSGGVDSLATFRNHRGTIKYLIFYQGSDIYIENIQRLNEVKSYIRQFADIYDKEFIVLSTNFHLLHDVSWLHVAQGCAMLGPILALSNYIDRAYIASSFSGSYRRPWSWGTHPDLDPLIRCNNTEIIHDGFETKRIEKIIALHKDRQLLRQIRVCAENIYDDYNCGKCEKCLRTTMPLSILGVDHEAVPFPKEAFSLDKIADFIESDDPETRTTKLYWCENFNLLRFSQKDIPGKDRLLKVLREFLGDFYDDYQRDFPSGLPEQYHCKNKWRKLEKRLGLRPDSLFVAERIFRLLKRDR